MALIKKHTSVERINVVSSPDYRTTQAQPCHKSALTLAAPVMRTAPAARRKWRATVASAATRPRTPDVAAARVARAAHLVDARATHASATRGVSLLVKISSCGVIVESHAFLHICGSRVFDKDKGVAI